MRYIKIPETIMVGSIAITFGDWLCDFVLVDAKTGKTAKDIIAAADLMEKVGRADTLLELSDAEHALIKGVVEQPTGGYNPQVAIKLVKYMKAVLDAPEEDPTKD